MAHVVIHTNCVIYKQKWSTWVQSCFHSCGHHGYSLVSTAVVAMGPVLFPQQGSTSVQSCFHSSGLHGDSLVSIAMVAMGTVSFPFNIPICF